MDHAAPLVSKERPPIQNGQNYFSTHFSLNRITTLGICIQTLKRASDWLEYSLITTNSFLILDPIFRTYNFRKFVVANVTKALRS